MAIFLGCWNPVEYIRKIIISFPTVSLDEINYGVRHIKLCKIQSQPFVGVLQDFGFLKNFAEIHLCRSVFSNKIASELWQNLMVSFVQPFNHCLVNHCIVNGQNDTNIRKEFFLKKLSICFWKTCIKQTSFL